MTDNARPASMEVSRLPVVVVLDAPRRPKRRSVITALLATAASRAR